MSAQEGTSKKVRTRIQTMMLTVAYCIASTYGKRPKAALFQKLLLSLFLLLGDLENEAGKYYWLLLYKVGEV